MAWLPAGTQKLVDARVPEAVKKSFAKQYPGLKPKWENEHGKFEAVLQKIVKPCRPGKRSERLRLLLLHCWHALKFPGGFFRISSKSFLKLPVV
jgi:hypothetical protein